jgi:hypothetical protein
MEVERASIQYPGGLAARFRWGGPGSAADVFSMSEAGGALVDHGPPPGDGPDRLCRAELRVEGPLGSWTARFASRISDTPQGLYWDTPGLLLLRYGFTLYALNGRTGDLRWTFQSATPLLSVLGSSRLPHVIAQGEVETTALLEDGTVAWRVTHSDVVVDAEIVGGRLVLGSWGGQLRALDAVTGREAA